MPTITTNTALILIDVQQAFDDPRMGPRNNPDAEHNMARLLADWRAHQRPIFHIQHMSTEAQSLLRPELPGNAIKPIVAPLPDEPLLQKTVNSAFIGTDLEQQLRIAGIEQVVIVGLTTNHCVSTSVRMAANLGFRTLLPEDATATFDLTGPDGIHYPAATLHAMEIASLSGEFATIITTADLITP